MNKDTNKNYINNAHSAYNGMISAQRNMFLTSSVAVLVIGFGKSFSRLTHSIIYFLGVLILCISIYIGLAGAYDFKYYLDFNKNSLPPFIPVKNWYHWIILSYLYAVVLFIIIILVVVNKVYPYNIKNI
jgi:hypothetical protein